MKAHPATQIPRGLADPQGEFAYVNGPGGLVYRLQLASGAVRARSDFPGTPLALYQGALIGWRSTPGSQNKLRIFVLAVEEKALRTLWEQEIILPSWVQVDSPETEWFNLESEMLDDELLVTWEARSRYPGGAPPPPGVEAAEERDASSALHIDLESGRILREEAKDPIRGTEQPLPQLPLNRRIVPYLRGEAWVTQPWVINSGEAFLVRNTEEAGVWLVRGAPGDPAEAMETQLSGDPKAVAAVTPDGGFIFIHEAGSEPANWVVYSAKTGDRVARLTYEPGSGEVAVVQDKVLYLVTQELGSTRRSELRCREMASDRALWSFTVAEETSMMAPPPPP